VWCGYQLPCKQHAVRSQQQGNGSGGALPSPGSVASHGCQALSSRPLSCLQTVLPLILPGVYQPTQAQELEGRRVPRTASGKTLPCFRPYDGGARAGEL
jgi:hypothetical protein